MSGEAKPEVKTAEPGLKPTTLEVRLQRLPPPLRCVSPKNTLDLVGNTPLLRLETISRATGCNVFGKCEWMNPSGSVKDRPVVSMILALEKNGKLDPSRASDFTLVEASGGNTAVALCFFARTRGYKCIVTMPESVSEDKAELCRRAGAEVIRCPMAPHSDTEKNYYHRAAQIVAKIGDSAVWTNQFENSDNFRGHEVTTGPEIYAQLAARDDIEHKTMDVFVCACGTGGTMGGVCTFTRAVEADNNVPDAQRCKFVIAECCSGGTGHFVKTGSFEGANPAGLKSVADGIGIGRMTEGFKQASPFVKDAVFVSDSEMATMYRFLNAKEGINVGPSAALNVVGAVKTIRQLKLPKGSNVVTILCDSGERYRGTVMNSLWWESREDRNVSLDDDLLWIGN